METLGLSESTPRSESRLKSLFWPSIQNGTDVDYLGLQGYWVCAVTAALSFALTMIAGNPVLALIVLLFYYIGGVGVRERSRYAAAVVLALFVTDTVTTTGPSVLRILIGALLLSNLRATWIASRWKPGTEEAALPPRLTETLGDKFADTLPQWLWPKVRIPYYIFSGCVLLITAAGLGILLVSHKR
jgi:hypothetical protein